MFGLMLVLDSALLIYVQSIRFKILQLTYFVLFSDPHKFMNKPSVIVIRSDYLYPKQPTFGRADEWYIEYASVVKTETPPDPDYDLNLEKVTIWNEWSCCTSCSTKPQTSEIITRTGMCSIRKLDPQIPIHIPADDAKNEASRIFKQWKRFDDLLTNEIDYKEKGIPCFSTLLWIEFDEIRTGLMKRFLSRETKNDKAGFYLQTDECSHDQYECMETRNACLKKEQQKEEEPFLAADTSKHIPAVPFVVPTQPPIKLTSPKTSTKTKRRKPPTTNEPQTSVPKWAWISGSIVATATLLGILFAVLYRTGALKCLKQRSGSESENETKK